MGIRLNGTIGYGPLDVTFNRSGERNVQFKKKKYQINFKR